MKHPSRVGQPGLAGYRAARLFLLEAIRWYGEGRADIFWPGYAYQHLAAALGLKGDIAEAQAALAKAARYIPHFSTLTEVRGSTDLDRPKFVEARERTVIEGLRKGGNAGAVSCQVSESRSPTC
jgi:hypothetical protein